MGARISAPMNPLTRVRTARDLPASAIARLVSVFAIGCPWPRRKWRRRTSKQPQRRSSLRLWHLPVGSHQDLPARPTFSTRALAATCPFRQAICRFLSDSQSVPLTVNAGFGGAPQLLIFRRFARDAPFSAEPRCRRRPPTNGVILISNIIAWY